MNWQQLRVVFAIGLIVLTGSACSSSRQVTREHNSELRVKNEELRVDRDSVVVAVHDTVMEVTTITVDRNENGDTVRVSTVTDRERARRRDAIAKQWTKTEVVRDTVVVEKRDSVFIKNTNLANPTNKASPVVSSLKWLFWIIVAVIALMIVVRIRGRP